MADKANWLTFHISDLLLLISLNKSRNFSGLFKHICSYLQMMIPVFYIDNSMQAFLGKSEFQATPALQTHISSSLILTLTGTGTLLTFVPKGNVNYRFVTDEQQQVLFKAGCCAIKRFLIKYSLFLALFCSPTCPEALQLPNAHQLLASFVHLSQNPVGLSVVSAQKTAD